VARQHEGKVRFLGISWRDSEDAMAAFLEEFDLASFPHVNDRDESYFARFGVPYQPAWVFLDSAGEGVRVLGALPEADLDAILSDLAEDRLPNA
jgi:hypothetical protein